MEDHALRDRITDAVLNRKGRLQANGWYEFQCPQTAAHNNGDRDPSAGWHPDKGCWKCHRCGARGGYLDLAGRLGVDVPKTKAPGRMTKEIVFELRRPDGTHVADKIRREFEDGTKTYSWRVPGHDVEGLHGLKKADLPLYGIHALSNDCSVVVVEGEWATDSLNEAGLDGIRAVGTVTGAGGTPSDDVLLPLKGRTVHLWPDNDDVGRQHMDRIGRRMLDLGFDDVRLIAWEEAPARGDAADHSAPLDLIQCATPFTPVLGGVAGLLHRSGVAHIKNAKDLDAIGITVRKLAELLDPTDAGEVTLAREGAIRQLTEAGVLSPARLIDAVFPRTLKREDDLQGEAFDLAEREPAQWPSPVDGRELVEDLSTFFSAYVSFPAESADHAPLALALWTIHTHAAEAANTAPQLGISSATKRCGKTTLLSCLSLVIHRALAASSITPAALFRSIERWGPTLLIDEADTVLKPGGNDDLRTIINSGVTRSTAHVVRCVGDQQEPRMFSTFGPKAIALIGTLPPTVADRSIPIPLERKVKSAQTRRFRRNQVEPHATELKRRAIRWAVDNIELLTAEAPELPETLNDRAQDVWEPLLAIADATEFGPKARDTAIALASRVEDDDVREQLLVDLCSFWRERPDKSSTVQILKYLCGLEQRLWARWHKGKELSSQGLAGLLKPFKIFPKGIKMPDGKTLRGYRRRQFVKVFEQYPTVAPPEQAQPRNPADQEPNFHETQPQPSWKQVADGSGRNPADRAPGCGVAGRNGNPRWEQPI